MDSLSELIRLLAPSGTVDLRCRVAGVWSDFNAQAAPGHVPYHVILEGQIEITVGDARLRATAGDVLLFPHGAAHTLMGLQAGSRTVAPSRHFNGVVTEVTVPGAAAPLDILCGTFVLGSSADVLLRTLPEVLCIGTDDANRHGDASWLRGLIGMMHAEADRPRPGGAAIVADLSTALFTVLLRALIQRGGVSRGLIALMADARMTRVVEAVVRAPEQPWTVDSLAALCNVSRATLARRFAQLGGMTPLELVTTLRMERAARLLRQDGLSAAAVGEQCGYASQAAFGRVFAQHFGIAPGAYRRQHRARRAVDD